MPRQRGLCLGTTCLCRCLSPCLSLPLSSNSFAFRVIIWHRQELVRPSTRREAPAEPGSDTARLAGPLARLRTGRAARCAPVRIPSKRISESGFESRHTRSRSVLRVVARCDRHWQDSVNGDCTPSPTSTSLLVQDLAPWPLHHQTSGLSCISTKPWLI